MESQNPWDVARVPDYLVPFSNQTTVTFICWTHDGTPLVFGSGAVIQCQEDMAVVVTAKHIVDQLFDSVWRGPTHHPSSPFVRTRTYNFERRDVRAICYGKNGISGYEIGKVTVAQDMDLALITIHAPADGTQARIDMKYNLDLLAPEVGEEVWSMGYEYSQATTTHNVDGEQMGMLKKTLNIKRGIVTAVSHDRIRQLKGPCFSTTIPFSAGESGRAVCRRGVPGRSIGLLGVVSYDLDDGRDRSDRQIAGESLVSLLWPTLGFPFEGRIGEGTEPRQIYLHELVSHGYVSDMSGTFNKYRIEKVDEKVVKVERLP